MSNQLLKPCPFCGEDSRFVEIEFVEFSDGEGAIVCQCCEAQGPRVRIGSVALQDWVGSQLNRPEWAQSIATIDAAWLWSGFPVEGEGHEL